MVRGKKSRKTGFPVQEQTDTVVSDTQKPSSETLHRDSFFFGKRFTFLDYLVVCLFFVAFCYLQKFVALKWFGVDSADPTLEGLSLTFFFGTMWKGFVIVALLAWLHDFFYQDTEEEDTA